MEKDLEKIWKKLNNLDDRINHIEDLVIKTPNIADIGKEYEKLSKETGLDIELLNELVYFEGGDFTILTEISGINNKEKQLNATLLILTISDICYNVNRMKSQDLKNKLAYLGISSLGNLSTHIKSIKNYIIPNGKRSSSEFSYKITLPGKKEGIKILFTLLKK